MGHIRQFPDSALAKWIRLIASVVIFPVLGWGIATEVRLQVMTGNRWTSGDQARFTQQHQGEHALIGSVLAEKADRDDVPPPEVREALDQIRRALERLEKRQDRIILAISEGNNR